jgi:ribosomal protein S18 acetylase RimI-like enzyme
MLAFTTAAEGSLEAFLSVSAASRYQAQLREYLGSLLRQPCTRPEWCVLGLDGEAPVARAAFWALPGHDVPTDLVLIEADWSDEELAAGRALLENMQWVAAGLGAGLLSHHVDAPPAAPQYQEDADARIRLLTECGYELLRDGLRWLYEPSTASDASPRPSLAFRALPEVGEDAFVEAIAATYEGTRDSWIRRSIAELGLLGAAREDFDDNSEMEHRPEWWELAYADDGALAGVVMAARNPTSAVVAYVGVVPEQRGRGLAAELVRRGTEQLLAAGATAIRGDCDRDNVGMVKAFERAGFDQVGRRRSYQRVLSS